MEVENDVKPVGAGLGSGPVGRIHPTIGDFEIVRSRHPVEWMQVDAHGVESGALEQTEVLVFEARLIGRSPERIVADDVDTTPKLAVLSESIDRRGLGADGRDDEAERECQNHPPGYLGSYALKLRRSRGSSKSH